LAVIKKEDYDALLKKIELKREKRLVDFLESLPYFGSLSRVALVKLKYLMMQKEYIKTMTVVKEKDPSTKVFIIRSGEFTVYKTTELFPNDKFAEKEEKEKFTL
jgi:CRP-like cAMP-binding protein